MSATAYPRRKIFRRICATCVRTDDPSKRPSPGRGPQLLVQNGEPEQGFQHPTIGEKQTYPILTGYDKVYNLAISTMGHQHSMRAPSIGWHQEIELYEKAQDQKKMQLQYCSDKIQQAFYRDLSLSSQTPEASQPTVEKKRSSISVLAAIKYSLGGTLFLSSQALACQVVTEVTAYVNFQHVMYF